MDFASVLSKRICDNRQALGRKHVPRCRVLCFKQKENRKGLCLSGARHPLITVPPFTWMTCPVT
ncbi:hypothetical protein GWJ21_10775 [Bacillus coagulans]|nr:hypothetical protein [Heyndrickxia coagulans]